MTVAALVRLSGEVLAAGALAYAVYKWVWPVARGLHAAFTVPKQEADAQRERADIWRQFGALNSKLDTFFAADTITRERLAVVESDVRGLKTSHATMREHINTLTRRITNVEERCDMTHRRGEQITVNLDEGEGNGP